MPTTTPTATPAPTASRGDPRDALPRLDRHKPKCGPVRKSKAGRWRALVLIAVHLLVGIHVLQWLLTGRTVTPVEPSEAGYLLDAGKLNAGFVLFAVLILGTLVFGRWFCGWACHVVALQDLSAWLLGKVGLRPRPVRSRLLVLAPFAVAFEMFFRSQLARWWSGAPNPPVHEAFTTDNLWERFPGPLMGVLTVVVVGFLCVWWLGAKGFCTYGCPYGAFFAVADRLGPGKIKVTDACDACGHCTSVCSSNVRVHEEVAKHKQVVDPGCMKCMDCVSVCPKEALYFGFAGPKPFARSQQKIAARADFTWPEEIALAALAFGGCVAFRGAWFGEGVPLLMSVGLGVITAALGLLGWRLWRRGDVLFQHTVLKQGGRWLPAGRFAFAGALVWTLFAGHTAFVNDRAQSAEHEARAVWAAFRQGGVDRERFTAASDALAAVDTWSLCTPPMVLALHGLLLRELGQHELAIRQFERMVARRWFDREPLVPQAYDALGNYYMGMRRFDDAERLARSVLAVFPDDSTAKALLQMLPQLRGGR
jgi:polyferredoxin